MSAPVRWWNDTWDRPSARVVASATNRALMSTPWTRPDSPTMSAIASAMNPGPEPKSSTRCPAPMAAGASSAA